MASYQRIKHVKTNSIQSWNRSFQLKKLHACSLSIKKTFKGCAFTLKNRQLISNAQSSRLSVGVLEARENSDEESRGAAIAVTSSQNKFIFD